MEILNDGMSVLLLQMKLWKDDRRSYGAALEVCSKCGKKEACYMSS